MNETNDGPPDQTKLTKRPCPRCQEPTRDWRGHEGNEFCDHCAKYLREFGTFEPLVGQGEP